MTQPTNWHQGQENQGYGVPPNSGMYTTGGGMYAPPVHQFTYDTRKPKHTVRNIFLVCVVFAFLLGVVGLFALAATVSNVKPGANDTGRGDFTVGNVQTDDIGLQYIPVTVKNPTSKESDFLATIDLDSADGVTQIAESFVAVNDLGPSQISVQKVYFLSLESIPPGAKVVLKNTSRTVSN